MRSDVIQVVCMLLGCVCYVVGVCLIRKELEPKNTEFEPERVMEFVMVRAVIGGVLTALYGCGHVIRTRDCARTAWGNVCWKSVVDSVAQACMLLGLVYLSDEDGTTVVYVYPLLTLAVLRCVGGERAIAPALTLTTWVLAVVGYGTVASVAHRPELWLMGEHVPLLIGVCGGVLNAVSLGTKTLGGTAQHVGGRQIANALLCGVVAMVANEVDLGRACTQQGVASAILHLLADVLCSVAWKSRSASRGHVSVLMLRFVEPAIFVATFSDTNPVPRVCVLGVVVALAASQMIGIGCTLFLPLKRLMMKYLFGAHARSEAVLGKFAWGNIRFIWKEYWLLIRMVLLGLVGVAISTETPVYEAQIIDYLTRLAGGHSETQEFDDRELWEVMTPFVVLSVLSVVKILLNIGCITIPVKWLMCKYKLTFVTRMLSYDRTYQEETKVASETIARQGETSMFLGPFQMIVSGIMDTLTMGRVCWIVFVFDWKLMFMMMATFPLEVLLEWALAKPIGVQKQQAQFEHVQYTNALMESLDSVRTLQRSGTVEQEGRKIQGWLEAVITRGIRIQLWSTSAGIAIAAASTTMSIFTWVYSARHIWLGLLTIGQVVAMSKYIPMIKGTAIRLATMYANILKWQAGVARVAEHNIRALPPPPLSGPPSSPAIEVNELSYSYPSESDKTLTSRVMAYPNFTIEPGTTVAVVGPNGAGKSTLLALLLREYDARTGNVLIGGKDTRKFDVRQMMHLVDQVSASSAGDWFKSRSIRENLTYGLNLKVCPTDAELDDACAAAGFHLKAGVDFSTTAVLSGGEFQRGLLVRAMLTEKPILLMDEPVACLDEPGQRWFYSNLKTLFPQRTIIIVTHHMYALEQFDRVLHININDEGDVDVQDSPPTIRKRNRPLEVV